MKMNNQENYYVIDHDIPPPIKSSVGEVVAQMRKGSSILLPNRNRVNAFTQYMSRHNIKWTTKKEQSGVRVWRLSDNQLFEIDMNTPKSS